MVTPANGEQHPKTSFARWAKYAFIILTIVLVVALLVAGLALPWQTLVIGREYRTLISNAPSVNVNGYAYDPQNDLIVAALSDGTLQLLPRQRPSVAYSPSRQYIPCPATEQVDGDDLLLHGGQVIVAGEIHNKSNYAGSRRFISVYDLASDTVVQVVPLAKTQSSCQRVMACIADTLYYADSMAVYQLSLSTPRRPEQPQLLAAESGPVSGLLPSPQGDGIIYEVSNPQRAAGPQYPGNCSTVREYRAGVLTTLFNPNNITVSSNSVSDLNLLSYNGENMVLSEAHYEGRNYLWQRANNTLTMAPREIGWTVAMRRRDFIAQTWLLGERPYRSYPVLALFDAATGEVIGYTRHGEEVERMLPLADGSFLMCRVDCDEPNFDYCLVSQQVTVRSDWYLAMTRSSRKLLSPLHTIVRLLYTIVQLVTNFDELVID